MKKIKKCYKCGEKATTREHVPPICLFPEQKDAKVNLRKNLITVPSCDEHNSKKSDDDEFLMVSLAACLGNNFAGHFHSNTKVQRALARKKDFYFTKVLEDCREIAIKSENGESTTAYVGKPDYRRLKKCFEHIAYGLYYHEFGKVFKGECCMILTFIFTGKENEFSYFKLFEQMFAQDTSNRKPKGSNPAIFTYLFSPIDHNNILGLKMTFYGNADVYVAFKEGKNEIFDDGSKFVTQIIKSGIRTIVRVNGQEIEFNKESNQK
jgi:hypothetical protein